MYYTWLFILFSVLWLKHFLLIKYTAKCLAYMYKNLHRQFSEHFMNCCSTEKEKVLIIGSRSHALDSTCLTKISLVKTNSIIKACVKRNVFFTTAKHVLDFGMKLLKPFLKTGTLIDCKFQTITDLKFSF